jgi:NAD(P)-dependent dehydrogenase (short-subunit alcohol dehydrogenase family)
MTTGRPLEGRRAIVTGGAQGIGAAIVRGLVVAGCRVAVLDLQEAKAGALAAELGAAARSVEADLSSEETCRKASKTARDWLGGVDIVVNCAAPGRDRAMIGRVLGADWPAHDAVVLRAALAIVDTVLPDLAASGCGAVVNVSSILGQDVAVDQGSLAYHASKAALDQATRWLAVRCGGQGVRVNAVAPGLVDRDEGRKLTDDPVHKRIVEEIVPLKRAGRGADIAQVVVFLASDQSSYITGQVLVVDGGLMLTEVFGAALRAFKAAGS